MQITSCAGGWPWLHSLL